MAEFKIIEAAKKGFIQTWNDRKNLFIKSIPAYLVHMVAFYFLASTISFSQGDETELMKMQIENNHHLYLSLGLLFVGIALLSYVFVYQARFILLGENDIPTGEEQRKSVMRTYSYAITFFVGFLIFKELLNQGSSLITSALEGVHTAYLILFGIVNIIISIWLLRFGVAHIPLAIDYSIKDFLRKVRGFKFSFYLMGLLVAVILPISFVSLISMAIIVEIMRLISENYMNYPVIIISAIFYVTGFLIVNSASVFALDDVMKNYKEETE